VERSRRSMEAARTGVRRWSGHTENGARTAFAAEGPGVAKQPMGSSTNHSTYGNHLDRQTQLNTYHATNNYAQHLQQSGTYLLFFFLFVGIVSHPIHLSNWEDTAELVISAGR